MLASTSATRTDISDRFEPAIYSRAELQFLLQHLDKPAHAALHRDVPAGVNPTAIEAALTQIRYYAELEQYEGVAWAGRDAVEDSITRYLDWCERVERIRALGGPAHPSMCAWDGDQAFKYAIGADSGDMPRTEILDDGTRRSFGVTLRLTPGESLRHANAEMPWVAKAARAAIDDKIETSVKGQHATMTCSICGHAEEFKPGSRNTRTAAHARMGRHMKTAKTEINRHRLLHRKVFS